MIKYIRSGAAIAASLEPSLIPSFLYSRQFQDDWHFGASLNVPMNVGAGLYHHLQNDWDVTLDVKWMEFSKFGVTDVYLEEGTLNVPSGDRRVEGPLFAFDRFYL